MPDGVQDDDAGSIWKDSFLLLVPGLARYRCFQLEYRVHAILCYA
jgi:hypothetical protein